MAAVAASEGAKVVVLERQVRYRDHVRGEILWPWGVRLARRLGLESLLVDAGALGVPGLDGYDEGTDVPTRIDVGAMLSGVTGSLNVTHRTACAALAEAAATAGANFRMGVRDARVSPGKRP